jgi:hypothetical protein
MMYRKCTGGDGFCDFQITPMEDQRHFWREDKMIVDEILEVAVKRNFQ